MSTGIGQPEDLAIAGLFHDIGVEGMLDDVSIFDMEGLSPEAKEIYMRHPKASLALLKDRRITVTPIISEIIEKHHERMDGKGFPAQLPAHKIPPEAHLLAYADAFEHLTRPRPGQPMMQPLDVHKLIVEKLGLPINLLTLIGKNLIAA
jgi:HD-GYP domain-containing protein (c-di-GMP phosphodiesterase class II)